MILHEFAPAKINLHLHVLGKRQEGYHELASLVTFANFGDDLSFKVGGDELTLTISGEVIEGDPQDNLILKAAKAFAAQNPNCPKGHFHLVKNLPVASGIGGGSSDAAAALRLLQKAYGEGDILALAKTLGADVPMCLDMKTRHVFGIGHDFGATLEGYKMDAILVNPKIAVPTKEIFKRLDIANILRNVTNRNDLEKAAIAYAPEIGALLTTLKQLPDAVEAHMSGSGATCFALFKNKLDASKATAILHESYPNYWVKQVVLGL